MRKLGKRFTSILLLSMLASESAYSRNKCVEGIYSNIGEAKDSGDMYGSSLIIVDQSRERIIQSQDAGPRRRVVFAQGIYSCTINNEVSSDLVRLEIAYPKFTFMLDMTQRCIPEEQRGSSTSGVTTIRGAFTDRGIWLESGRTKELLPRTKTYCHPSGKSVSK